MSSDQLAVARTYAPAQAKRQGNIPGFLDKLYNMVNDPNTDLIRWSDDGDSFIVVDQEKFSKEILGRWFKHQNFGSFVRQLNLYGFRKVPHLQQGALHSDQTEPLCFENSNFRRNQSDLLQLISRKKQAVPGRDDVVDQKVAATTSTSARSLTSGTGTMDVNGLLTGIAAIKRHQATISTELNDLKRSNQALWQEAITARERYQRQQDTVERILKFLAGVFGQANVSQSQDPTPTAPSSTGMQLQPKRLMIEGSSAPTDEASRFVEHNSPHLSQDDDDMESAINSTPPPEQRPGATISSVDSPAMSRPPFVNSKSLDTPTTIDLSAPPTVSEAGWNAGTFQDLSPFENADPNTASFPNIADQQQDPVINSFLATLLTKPSQFQKVMNAMQALSPGQTSTDTNGNMVVAQNQLLPSALDPSTFPNTFPTWPAEGSIPGFDLQLPAASNSELAPINPLYRPLAQEQQHLDQLASSNTDLDAHISAVDHSLHSLMQTLGMPADSSASHLTGGDMQLSGIPDFGLHDGQQYGDQTYDPVDWNAILDPHGLEDDGLVPDVIEPSEPVSLPAKRKATVMEVDPPRATKRATRKK